MKKNYAIPAVLLSLLATACAVDAGPETGDEVTSASNKLSFELDSQFIRGFIADGTGCRTVGDPIVGDNTVTFILADYIAEKEGTGLARATCDVAVAVALPPGLSISLDEVVYRGFTDGSSARSTFFREYFFAGQFLGDRRFTVIDYDAGGNASVLRNDSDQYMSTFGEFTALDEVLSVGVSPCGEEVVWRANTALSLRNTRRSSFSLSSIDTVDIENQFFVTFRFRPFNNCQ
jgi:Domain of unknown function (DUF4360)